ncbi:MAG TPA: sn-glycerol-3-phosphate ABC transporter ATP-binding protein UgpC [Solirubrobacteraceae bacterium]|jgi:ABC-type sugar transport system ATPase subunit|nr:sn-glycerol-3-phosphate ABC transporter ATP-binding protein UgpC [Solirubrobacteraceae bacterium]
MPGVTLEAVSKVFPGGAVAVDELTLEIEDGEFMILVGSSGCGKTTALRMVAGLESPTGGTIRIGERVVNDISPRDRDIAMVFQNYALYPHMSVARNLGYPLRQRGMARREIAGRVREVAQMLSLDELLDRRPAQLSGGQRQRVAMGRALVREPEVFLLDEPLSNLDAKLRVQMRAALKRLHARLGVTTIYVTHDQVEAMTLGDRIAVISDGKLQQLGAPQEVYDRPANVFVAGFIGSPPMNLLKGSVRAGQAHAGDLTVPCPGVDDGEVILGIRPECLRPAVDGLPSLGFEVAVVEPLGDEVIVHGVLSAELATPATGEEGREVVLVAEESGRAEAVARLEPQQRPREGETIRLAVEVSDVYLFDAGSGLAIR